LKCPRVTRNDYDIGTRADSRNRTLALVADENRRGERGERRLEHAVRDGRGLDRVHRGRRASKRNAEALVQAAPASVMDAW